MSLAADILHRLAARFPVMILFLVVDGDGGFGYIMSKVFLERDKAEEYRCSQGRKPTEVAKTSLRICSGWMMCGLTLGSGLVPMTHQ